MSRQRLPRWLPAICLVSAMLIAAPGTSWAFPDHDPSRERELLGPAIREGSPKDAADMLGAWGLDAGGLALQAAGPGDLAWWMPRTSDALLVDGLVRLTLQLGPRPDLSLLLRATVDAGIPEDLDAYGVSLDPSGLSLHRWRRGVPRTIAGPIPMPDLASRKSLEIVAVLWGPWILAHVHDAQNLELLASISAHDDGLRSGRVGVRAHVNQDPATRFTRLTASLRPAAPSLHPIDPPGSEVLARLDPSALPRVPSDLAPLLLQRSATGAEMETWILTDRVGFERLLRAQVPVLERLGEVPFWAMDARYRERMDRPPTATATGFRLDESLKDERMAEAVLRGQAERHPELATLVEIGRSSAGRPILALRIAGGEGRERRDRPSVLLMAAHHASELLTIDYALDAVSRLLDDSAHDPRARALVEHLEIWIVPVVNPDGVHGFTRVSRLVNRKNFRDVDGDARLDPSEGVDLNRNYPFRWGSLGEKGSRSWPRHFRYRGPEPASEPEVRAVMALADAEKFAAAVTWHTNATAVLSPYTIDGARSPAPDLAWVVAEPLVRAMRPLPGGRRFTLKRKLYGVDGTDQDWLFFAHGTLAYNVEGSHHNPQAAAIQKLSIDAQRPFWEGLLKRVVEGPRVSGHVLDEQGRPLQAEVAVLEIRTFEDEIWKSRARDGRFDRLLPASGDYTLRFRAPGFREEIRRARVRDTLTLEVTLKRETPASP